MYVQSEFKATNKIYKMIFFSFKCSNIIYLGRIVLGSLRTAGRSYGLPLRPRWGVWEVEGPSAPDWRPSEANSSFFLKKCLNRILFSSLERTHFGSIPLARHLSKRHRLHICLLFGRITHLPSGKWIKEIVLKAELPHPVSACVFRTVLRFQSHNFFLIDINKPR